MAEAFDVPVFEVRRDAWGETRVVCDALGASLAQDEVLLKVDRFALTANNISYCAAGDSLGYWGFFPAQAGWGRIPVMGYGEVLASAHSDIEPGERVWGFFPMATQLKIVAGRVNRFSFADVSPHRGSYAPVYSQFQRAGANPLYDPMREDQDSLLRGLFLTAWLAEDFMFDNGCFGADSYLITSASSKTSIALGHCVRQRGQKKSVGLTSASRLAFCQGLGCYDEVLSYEQIASLDPAEPVVLVDMAGNATLNSALHHHYRDNMKYSCRVGATHYDQAGPAGELPGAAPQFFFAPSQAQKRSSEWGKGQVELRVAESLLAFQAFCDGWLQIVRGNGEQAVEAIYQSVLAGNTRADQGHILSMWPA